MNKEVNVYRMYNNRPARITVVVPANSILTDGMEIKPEQVLKVEYLDEEFEKAFDKSTRKRIQSEISIGVKVKRLPRKEKKALKISVGVPNCHGRVCLVRATLHRTVTGFDLQIRRK